MSAITTENKGVTLPHDRMMVCLEAVWELDALARVLPGLVPLEDDQAHFVVRGIAGRLLRLTSVLMSGIGDEPIPTEKLQSITTLGKGQG